MTAAVPAHVAARRRGDDGSYGRVVARWLRGERARLALLSDVELHEYLGRCAARLGNVTYRAAYRAAWHEACVVRGARGIPRA